MILSVSICEGEEARKHGSVCIKEFWRMQLHVLRRDSKTAEVTSPTALFVSVRNFVSDERMHTCVMHLTRSKNPNPENHAKICT